ncbi:hypothetical protein RDI58_001467 [Solanum bulbocastanum]|uniref:Uncharacterized protein n=1 Tax=Solanum bulbocastanum TaxID=147425 RepID=A0AAN8YN79_SOLBU
MNAVNAADVEPNLELSLALRNRPELSPLRNEPAPRQNEQAAAGINLVLSLATRYVPAPRPIIDQAAVLTLSFLWQLVAQLMRNSLLRLKSGWKT